MVFNLFTNDTDNSTNEPQEESSTDNDNSEAQQRENNDTTDSNDFPYDFTPVKRETLGDKHWAEIGADGDYYAGAHVRAQFENARNNPEQKLYFGANLDDQRGLKPGAIQFNNLFQHLWTSGASGYGKSTVQKNYMVQLAEMGYGFVYFDPKAEDSLDFLKKLPEHRRDDVVWIEPGSKEYGKNIGINILGVSETDDETEKALEIADKLENLRAVFDQFEFWGPNMEGITTTIGRGMMNHNADPDTDTNYTVMDMFLVLANQTNRRQFADNVEDPFVRLALDKIADMDDEEIWPIFNRMRNWATDNIVREIISQREDTLDFDKAIAEDKIIIVRTPVSSESVMRMVALTVMRGVWTAVQRRAADTHNPRPYFAIADEFDVIASENLDVENILARARSMNLSAMLSTQYPSQLTSEVRTAMQNNCDNKVVFYHGKTDDASVMMENFRDYGAGDNMETDMYEVWMQLRNDDGEKQEATKLQTYPEYPPVRSEEEVQEIIKDSLDRYGSESLTTRDILEQLPEEELGINVDDLLYMLNDADGLDNEEDEGTPFDTTPDPLDTEFPDTLPESEFTHTVATAQLQTGVGRDGYANLDTLDTLTEHISGINREFLTTLAEEITSKQHTDIRVINEENTYWFGLTNPAQTKIYEQDTGDAATDGETEAHTPLLYTAQSTLTTLGYHVDIIPQDGTELPDGTAAVPVKNTLDTNVATPEQFEEQLETYHAKLADVHPSLLEMSHGRDLSIEAETSPGKKPVRPLVNLRKAVNEDRKCLFIVKDDGKKLDRYAARISRILNAPAYVSDNAEGLKKYYNHSHSEHEATITKDDEQFNLAAPKTRGGSNWWDTESGEYALKSNKTTDAHITTAEPWNLTYSDIKGSNVAYYQRDHSEQKYYVWVPDGNGFTKREYDTKAQFQEDWAKIHEPFIPTREFGEELPDEDDYTILIDTDEDRTNVPNLDYVPSVVQYNVKNIRDDAHQTVDAEYTPVLQENEEPPHTANFQDIDTPTEQQEESNTTDTTDSSGGSGGSIIAGSFPSDNDSDSDDDGGSDIETPDSYDETEDDDRENPDEPGSSSSSDSDNSGGVGNGFNKDVEFGGANTDVEEPFDTTEDDVEVEEEADSTEEQEDEQQEDSSTDNDSDDNDSDDNERIFG